MRRKPHRKRDANMRGNLRVRWVGRDVGARGSYNCIDPDVESVNDDDGDGGTLVVNDDTDTATDDAAGEYPVE